jgi:HD-like signal output (HDOD) protein
LGKNTLRLLIAKAAFRPVINVQSGRLTHIAAPYLWDQSDKCSFACRLLAQREQVDPFGAFLAGLMQNVGMIIALRIIDQVYEGGALPASDQFRISFMQYARRLSALTATSWDLPEAIQQVLQELWIADPKQEKSPLANVVFASDQLSKLRILINQGHLADQGAHFTAALPEDALDCLQKMNETA